MTEDRSRRRLARGTKIALAWGMIVQIILLSLVGLTYAHVNEVVSSHSRELITIAGDTVAAKREAAIAAREGSRIHYVQTVVLSLDRRISTALSESRHPSEVDQSIVTQVCQSIDHLVPGGCRIP